MILYSKKIEEGKVYFSVEDTKNSPVEIFLIDVNSNTVISKSRYENMDESYDYWISVPLSCLPNLGKSIFRAESIDGVINLEIDFGNIIEPVVINKTIFKSSFNDRENFYTFKEIFYDKIYHNEVVKIEENDIVVDIGANVGFFAVYSRQFNPKKIICLEPDIKNYMTLLENTKNLENVSCYNLAISDENGIMPFCYSYLISACSHLKKFNEIIGKNINLETNVLTIDVEKLFDLFNLPYIDYLKLDCEGAEQDIFKTIKDYSLKKIKKISLEFHTIEIRNQITEKLIQNGFEITKEFFLHNSNTVGAIFAKNQNFQYE
jgi:FkbM family methyltransferase